MKRLIAVAAFTLLAWSSAEAGDISGAGATFPCPV